MWVFGMTNKDIRDALEREAGIPPVKKHGDVGPKSGAQECCARVTRGDWYIGPCVLPIGHSGQHNPQKERTTEEWESIYGCVPVVITGGKEQPK